MIYLIDDDRGSQQQEYGVTYLNSAQYYDVIKPIYKLTSNDDISMFSTADCILLHESFPDFDTNGETLQGQNKISQKIRNIARDKSIPLVIFSNGILELEPDQISDLAITSLNKRLFYLNLEAFIKKFINDKLIFLKILPYGPNFIYSELMEFYGKIAQIVNTNDSENFRSKIQPLVIAFADKTNNGESIIEKSEKLSGTDFLKYLEKIIQSVFNYGKNIYP